MPAKSICPNCGQKSRGPQHICIPTSVERMNRRKRALAAAQAQSK